MSEYEQVEHGSDKRVGKRGEKKINESTRSGMRRLIQRESRDGAYNNRRQRQFI